MSNITIGFPVQILNKIPARSMYETNSMEIILFLVLTLPTLALCSGEGNIHLLEEEVAAALKSCLQIQDIYGKDSVNRSRRADIYSNNNRPSRIDNTDQEYNPYNHVRRNDSFKNQIYILNDTDHDYLGYKSGDKGEKFIKSVPHPALSNANGKYLNGSNKRIRRSEPLLSKDEDDQCLSQCVFANLQMVDSQGIPREAEMWNQMENILASQQSRVLLRDQLRACFQELQSESEDNGCSYSNKLERCLMLRFTDRKTNQTRATT